MTEEKHTIFLKSEAPVDEEQEKKRLTEFLYTLIEIKLEEDKQKRTIVCKKSLSK